MDPRKFISVAEAIAGLSKDRSTKVGAIVLNESGTILSVGYNGFPRGVKETDLARHEKPEKYFWTSHAEENAIAQAARVGAKLEGGILIVTAIHPCTTCARLIIQAGIKTVLVPYMDENNINERWFDEAARSKAMFREAGVKVLRQTRELWTLQQSTMRRTTTNSTVSQKCRRMLTSLIQGFK